MAALNDTDRARVWAEYMRQNREPFSLTKQDLRNAVNAADDWVDANAVAFNLALPLTARQELTVKQKAELLLFVVRRRFEVT